MKLLKFVITIALTINLFAAQPEKLLFIPWGNSTETVKYREEPGYRFGPQNFQVASDDIALIDPLNRAVKHYKRGKLTKQVKISPAARDFSQIDHNGMAKSTQGESGSVKLIDNYTAEIRLTNNNTQQKILVNHNNPKLASMRYLGSDQADRYYVDVNIITNQIPLVVNRQVQILDNKGRKLGQLNIPHHYFTKIFEDLKIDPEGNLYHMLSSADGIHIFRWNSDDIIEDQYNNYPEKFDEKQTFHTDLESANGNQKKPLAKPATVISREQTLAIADTYVQHEWVCKEENLTEGVVTDPDGDKILTADWIQIGTNQRVPYKWGGFDLLSVFDNGLENGDYAGDTYTDGNVGSKYARGVDCSGYVSRCWQLPYQVSTRQMDDPAQGAIVQQYNSWADLKPGDAIHRHGHVILFVKHNDNGSLKCVEAAASTTDWKVDYSIHYPYGLTEYKPVFYRNMEGAPIPSPQNLTLHTQSDTELKIAFNGVDEANRYLVHFGTHRDSLNDTQITTSTEATLSGLMKNTPYYIKVQAKNDEAASILPNEIFAAATSDNPHNILVVNGFDRSSNTTRDYITRLARPVTNNGYGFSYAQNESVYNNKIALTDFHSVIWILGDESSADDTFNSTEQELVKEFLRGGGNLFVTGSEIGWDLEGRSNHPTTADKNFYHNFLKARYYSDAPLDQSGEYYAANSIECAVFNKLGKVNFDDGSHGTINVDWPDAIKPANGSAACMTFDDVSAENGVAGIEYAGIFPGGTKPGKLVYLTFPVETVYPEEKRTEIIRAVMNYFDSPGENINEQPVTLTNYQLDKNYPNPFNPATTISYHIPQPGLVELQIHDISGRLVETLENMRKSAGSYQQSWHANDQGSGVYFYTLKVFDQTTRQLRYTKTEKCILLK